jgi:hypothetical protein
MAAMLAPSAMRAAHVRTAPHSTRACTCCADYSRGSAARERRAQRRREAAAWRREAEQD